MIDRQELIGWIILLWSGGYIFYLLKVRLLGVGPPLETPPSRRWIARRRADRDGSGPLVRRECCPAEQETLLKAI